MSRVLAPRYCGAKESLTHWRQFCQLAMMLRYSLDGKDAADAIEGGSKQVLDLGLRTQILHQKGAKLVRTQPMGDAVLSSI